MRIVEKDLEVIEGERIRLVGIEEEVMREKIDMIGNERKFEKSREEREEKEKKERRINIIDDKVEEIIDKEIGIVKMEKRNGKIKGMIIEEVNIGEDEIFVRKNV